MSVTVKVPDIDRKVLRSAVQKEYAEVADHPDKGYHFHTGRSLAQLLDYDEALLDGVPETALASFAGTGNPFSLGKTQPGEHVVDVGSGAGFDSLIAARLVGPEGQVIGVDMTPAMLAKARDAARETGMTQVEFQEGYAESLPVPDGWADVVISNGVVNLCPNKAAAFGEMYRVLKPGGRLQIADIMIQRPISETGKQDIDLWTG